MIRVPGEERGRSIDANTMLVDLFPTLLEVLAGEPPDPALPGRALLGEGAEEAASRAYLATLGGADAARFGLVEGDYKYVVSLRDGVWNGELFRRGREDVNLAGPAPHIASAMRGRLDGIRAALPRGPEAPRRALSPADRARLHSLGYVEAPRAPGSDGAPWAAGARHGSQRSW